MSRGHYLQARGASRSLVGFSRSVIAHETALGHNLSDYNLFTQQWLVVTIGHFTENRSAVAGVTGSITLQGLGEY